MEYILTLCRKFTHERQETMTQLKKIVQVDDNVRSVFEYGDSIQGRKWLFVFLRTTREERRLSNIWREGE